MLVVALVGIGLFLLAATQSWTSTVVEIAPGAPRTRVAATGNDLVPWGSAAALAGAVAVLVAMATTVRPRARTGLLVMGCAGSASALAAAGTATTALHSGNTVVSASATGWLWVALGSAVVAVISTTQALLPRADRSPTSRGASQRPAVDDGEAERRRTERAWRQLSQGHDPTTGDQAPAWDAARSGEAAGTMGPDVSTGRPPDE